MQSFPQVLKNVRTSRRFDVASIQHFPEVVTKLEEKLSRTGRILVRPSEWKWGQNYLPQPLPFLRNLRYTPPISPAPIQI